MTRTRDRLWEFAEQLGNHFRCKLCEGKFSGGILKIRLHFAGNPDGNFPSCPSVTQEVKTLALDAINSQNKKTKSLSHPMASKPLTDIQRINSSETSTKKRQDCLDDSLPKHVLESSNRAEICEEGGEMTRNMDMLRVHAEQSGYHFSYKCCKDKFLGGNLRITSHGAGTIVPKHIETEASAAITPQKKRAKGLSHPSTPMPLTNIQEIDTSETSTERGQDCPDESLPRYVSESSNQAEICGKGFTKPNLPKDKSLRLHMEGAVSEPLIVEDSHGEFGKKHFPLLPSDYVWRLVGVAISGQAHRQLRLAGIVTVKDFVDLLCLDEARLKNIVGGGISDAMWKHTLEHARSCVNVDKMYAYYFNENKFNGIVFNWCFEPKGLITEGLPRWMEALSGGEKVYLESLCEIAYKNPDKISDYQFNILDF